MTNDELAELEKTERSLRYAALHEPSPDRVRWARETELELYRQELGDDE